jgi:myo-inositol 2-dehydrogenase / D-chiro-inositol 1-dehydrogenase
MPARLNVALVDAGLMGLFHAESLAHRLPGARLVMAADADEATGRGLIRRLGQDETRYERDAQAAIEDPSAQAVVIATPARSHADLMVAPARATKPAFTEKPLAHTFSEADRAIRAVKTGGTFLQVGFQRRFDRGFARARSTRRTPPSWRTSLSVRGPAPRPP